MPSADLRLGDHVRIFVTLAFDDVGDKKAGPRPVIDKDIADAHEGFVEFGGNLHDPHPGWDIIVGRQEASFGTGRLLDNNEGVNVRSAFDGVRIEYDKPQGRWEAFTKAATGTETRFPRSAGLLPIGFED